MTFSTSRRTHQKLRRRVLEQSMVCFYCDRPLTEASATIDHLIPRVRGGGTHMGNLVACCLRCNKLKGNLTVYEFAGQ